MRYDKTERLGVIETDRIVTKDIGWIFREQPIVDVGLDAIIEQSVDGNPKGKFLAVQIKTGKGNFSVSSKTLTYYVSHIHYNYWLNLNIPIILVAHIPETEKTCWQQISEQTLKKTKKRWKLDIPLNQELSSKSKTRLTQILSNKSDDNYVFELYSGKIDPDSIFDIAENVNCIAESIVNVNAFINLLGELKEYTDSFNVDINKYNERGLTLNDFEVKARIKGFSRQINVISKKIESETLIFSQLYSEGFFAYEQVILLYYLFTNDSKEFNEAKKSISVIPPSIEKALIGIKSMRNSIAKLPNNISVLKESKRNLLEIVDMVINEYSEAKQLAIKIIENLNSEK
nr:DUF4365 domain-containing protein [uncultured Draconibacterium sp.]